MTRYFGLLGYPLGHSFSKQYFTDFFEKESLDCKYLNFELENASDMVQVVATNEQLKGFSVTIPHKENIIKHLDKLDKLAQRVGAVNCVKINPDRTMTGYNTDVVGFGDSLKDLLQGSKPKALVLGSGGASKAVRVALEDMEIEYVLVSRTARNGAKSYDDLTFEDILNHKLIINTTPLGMFPNIDNSPNINYEAITNEHFAFDLVYNPLQTQFLEYCKAKGAKTRCGIDMLHIQAQAAWKIFNK